MFQEVDATERAERQGFRWCVRRGDIVLAICATEDAAKSMQNCFNPGTVIAQHNRRRV